MLSSPRERKVNFKNIEQVRNAWEHLVGSNIIDRHSLRDEIAMSWERCRDRKVSPYALTVSATSDTTHEGDTQLIKVAEPHMRDLYTHLQGSGFIVVLTNAQGHILHVIGDRKMVSAAEELSVVPGASFEEHAMGTTSPGICTEKKIPIQVIMYEHYCSLFHTWCCSAAPIFDQFGTYLGALDISNKDKTRHHAYLLDFVRKTAQTIGLERSYRMLQGDLGRTYQYMQGILDDSPRNLVCFDKLDGLSHINKSARKMVDTTMVDELRKELRQLVAYQIGGMDMHRLRLQLKTRDGLYDVDAYVNTTDNKHDPFPKTICSLTPATPAREKSAVVRYTFESCIHGCAAMRDVIEDARNLAANDINIFLSGESGTGKEVLAQAIHGDSPRADKPFVAINCAGLPKELIQSELFGYVDGAFTGARRKGQAGKFEQANGGTLFLDEIGDMPLEAQANLLRVLQEKYIVRLGCDQPVPVDVRIISATNKDLMAEVEAGRFRQDLYYRLVVIDLAMPPLRVREGDLWLLIDHFSRKMLLRQFRYKTLTFSEEAKTILQSYTWPGNVRELENAVLYMMTKTPNGLVQAEHLPKNILRTAPQLQVFSIRSAQEREMIDALHTCNYNISKAADMLGIGRATMYRRMKKFGFSAQ